MKNMKSPRLNMFWLGCFALLKIGAALEMELATGVSFPGTAPLVSPKLPATASLPILKLPYATYQANSYDAENDIYVFANIRFAATPNGTLRWREPLPPPIQAGIQNGSYGGTCCQPEDDSGIGLETPTYHGLKFQNSEDLGGTEKRKVLNFENTFSNSSISCLVQKSG